MTQEEPFIQAVVANPNDDGPRLLYADWLEERGDPRAEYLRVECLLSSAQAEPDKVGVLRRRFVELRSQTEPRWLAIFDQPALLRANPTPFPAGWLGFRLKGYREIRGTYALFPYDSLPRLPVEEFRGDFGWLRPSHRSSGPRRGRDKKVDQVEAAAVALGLRLPKEYRLFLGSRALQRRCRSCTDCDFDLPRRIAKSPGGEGAYLIRFYSDSQGCLHWYLYVPRQGAHCVVASPGFYGGFTDAAPGRDYPDRPSKQFWFCAPSLEAFIYRCWIENEIWFTLYDDPRPQTACEKAYLGHYRHP